MSAPHVAVGVVNDTPGSPHMHPAEKRIIDTKQKAAFYGWM